MRRRVRSIADHHRDRLDELAPDHSPGARDVRAPQLLHSSANGARAAEKMKNSPPSPSPGRPADTSVPLLVDEQRTPRDDLVARAP